MIENFYKLWHSFFFWSSLQLSEALTGAPWWPTAFTNFNLLRFLLPAETNSDCSAADSPAGGGDAAASLGNHNSSCYLPPAPLAPQRHRCSRFA